MGKGERVVIVQMIFGDWGWGGGILEDKQTEVCSTGCFFIFSLFEGPHLPLELSNKLSGF